MPSVATSGQTDQVEMESSDLAERSQTPAPRRDRCRAPRFAL